MAFLNKSCEECFFQDVIPTKEFSSSGKSTSYSSLILVFISLAIIYNQKWFKKSKSEQKGRDIKELTRIRPTPMQLPPLPELLAAGYNTKKYGIRVLDDWWRSIDFAGIARFELPFNNRAICVMDPELLKKVLGSTDPRVLNKPKLIYDIIFPNLLTNGLLASRVPVWQPHRKVLNRFFTYNSLHSHLKVLNKYGKALSTSLHEKDGKIEEAFLSTNLYDQLLNVILEVLMGPDYVSKTGTSDFIYHFRKLKPLLPYRLLHPLNLLPPVWWLNPVRTIYEKTVAKTDAFIINGIDHETLELDRKMMEDESYEENPSHGITYLDHMLRANFTRKEIEAEIGTLLMAGHETTYGGLGFLLQHLAENPAILQACQEEVDELFANYDDPEAEISMEDLSNLKYLERCIYESIRISPTVPLISRQLADGIDFEGFHLEKGTLINIPVWLVHRNPEVYPEPEKFDPDRFLPDVVKARNPYAYLPFSSGPRNCIGWKLALMEMKIFMAYLLKDYDVETTDKFTEMKLEFEITLVPERNFNTTLKQRVK